MQSQEVSLLLSNVLCMKSIVFDHSLLFIIVYGNASLLTGIVRGMLCGGDAAQV